MIFLYFNKTFYKRDLKVKRDVVWGLIYNGTNQVAQHVSYLVSFLVPVFHAKGV